MGLFEMVVLVTFIATVGKVAETVLSRTREANSGAARERVDALEVHRRAIEAHISIAPGPMFSASQRYRNFIRLSVGQAWGPRHEKALREIGRMARELAGEEAVAA